MNRQGMSLLFQLEVYADQIVPYAIHSVYAPLTWYKVCYG